MQSKCRVLVVDADETVAVTLATILNKNGFDAAAAFSGPEALKLAYFSRFDALVTDVTMEPLNGVQVAIAFRNLYPASHILLLTGRPDSARLLLSTANAGYDFRILSKPIDPHCLMRELCEVCSAPERCVLHRPANDLE